jgi:hypothetical protein
VREERRLTPVPQARLPARRLSERPRERKNYCCSPQDARSYPPARCLQAPGSHDVVLAYRDDTGTGRAQLMQPRHARFPGPAVDLPIGFISHAIADPRQLNERVFLYHHGLAQVGQAYDAARQIEIAVPFSAPPSARHSANTRRLEFLEAIQPSCRLADDPQGLVTALNAERLYIGAHCLRHPQAVQGEECDPGTSSAPTSLRSSPRLTT